MENTLQPEAEIIQIIFDVTGHPIQAIAPDSSFEHDLGMDSLDVITVCCEVEKKFKIIIAEKDIPAFKTVNALVLYVVKMLHPIE